MDSQIKPPKIRMSTKPKVLLVDDDTILLRSLRRLLEQHDMVVGTVTCAREAMLELMQERYDGVICDYKMSGKNGKELLKQIREEFPGMFRIMLTGELCLGESLMVKERDKLDSVLQKPCEDQVLVGEIYEMLERRRSLGKRLLAIFNT